MLGNLASWLRILDNDTVYVREADDESLLRRAEAEGRILLTRDRALAERARGRGVRVHLLGPGSVAVWLADLHRSLGLPLEPKFERCSLCNGAPLRPAGPGDLAGKDYVPKEAPRPATQPRFAMRASRREARRGCEADPAERERRGPRGPLWACPDCGQVYWEGGHWRNIRRILDEARRLAQA